MRRRLIFTLTLSLSALALSGCIVAKTTGKVAALPFKAVGKTAEVAGKTVYHSGRLAGTGVYQTGKFAGQSAYMTGKGVYYMGRVPVQITDKALDTSTKVLTVTTQVVNLSGDVMTLSKQIQSYELDSELAALRHSANLISVVVDAAK